MVHEILHSLNTLGIFLKKIAMSDHTESFGKKCRRFYLPPIIATNNGVCDSHALQICGKGFEP